ncbi:MAG: AzlD domain-containing protein [Cardiobacteriaceae bacterium]|nr:AzlD domain-containing protein [Cardiobacteriaceae bacterium]
MNHTSIASAVIVSAIITFSLRLFPLVLSRLARRFDKIFSFLGATMPPGVMMILTVYSVSTLRWQSTATACVSIAALISVCLFEHYWRNPIISILVGMVLYVSGQSLLALP